MSPYTYVYDKAKDKEYKINDVSLPQIIVAAREIYDIYVAADMVKKNKIIFYFLYLIK